MNRDVSTLLEAAMSRSWSVAQATALLGIMSASMPGTEVDWDEGAGEYWARCIDGGRVVAFVGMKWPLVILLARRSGVAKTWGQDVELLLVDDMDAPSLRADQDTLERFSVRQAQPSAFNGNAFSAEDLVWLTV